jgi:hypothetical protein
MKTNYYTLTHFIYCFFFILFCIPNTHAQKLKELKESGTYKMRIEKTMSEAEAERLCIERAKINAIEKAFGQTIIQGNSTYIKNKTTGEQTESSNIFSNISESLVNGEWVQDLKKPVINKLLENNELWMQAEVYGIIRELKSVLTSFQALPLNCTNTTCRTQTFRDGDDFYLYFKAPEDGYISVYLDDPEQQKTFRLLPYKKSKLKTTNYPVKADVEYFFFSEAKAAKNEEVDETTLFLNNPKIPEMNKLFVLFNPKEEFGKPILNQASEPSGKIETPLELASEDFQRWLQLTRKGTEIQLMSLILNINPKKL